MEGAREIFRGFATKQQMGNMVASLSLGGLVVSWAPDESVQQTVLAKESNRTPAALPLPVLNTASGTESPAWQMVRQERAFFPYTIFS